MPGLGEDGGPVGAWEAAGHLLIVEDSPTQAAHLTFLLEQAGFRVAAARDGEAALALLAGPRPQAIISDIVLPGMSGYEFCRKVKADAALRGIPVMLATSLSSPGDILHALESGADSFIRKPLEEEQLLARLRYLLRHRALRAGDDPAGVEVEFGGRRHLITAERRQILDLLVTSYAEAVTLHGELAEEKRQLEERVRQRTATLRAEIAERQRVEHELRETGALLAASERRHRALTEAGAAVIWRVDRWGASFEARGWEALTGNGQCGLRGDTWPEAAHPEDRPAVAAAWAEARRANQPLDVEFRLGVRGGGWSWVRARGVPVLGADGSLVEWIGVMEDIQARRLADAELRRTRAFLDQVLDVIPVGVVVKDAEGRLSLANRAAAAMLGAPEEALIGRRDGDLFPADQAEASRRADAETLALGRAVVTQGEVAPFSAPAPRVLRTTRVPMRAEEGRFLVAVSEDITDRQVIEERLRQSQKMEAVGQLTGGLAHDFNNLLGVIIGNLDVLAEQVEGQGEGSGEVGAVLQGALEAALRGAELTKGLLAFARRQPLQIRRLAVNELVAHNAQLLRRVLGEAIEVELVLASEAGAVMTDAALLETALTNLAVNARDAMPAGGRLIFRTCNAVLDEDYAAQNPDARPGAYVAIEVTDSGTGMSEEVQRRVFEPFYTTKEVGRGTGLGLSMVFGFVKQSGGHIKLYSELGHGTTIRLYLPQADDEEARAAAAQASEPEKSRAEGIVLLVEDNESLRQVAVRQLASLGYQAIEAASGQAALEALAAAPRVDLMLTDVIMPGGMNGWELAAEARRLRPGLRVLFSSGFPDVAFGRDGKLPDDARLLLKPYRKAELARVLAEVMAAAP